ncbi:hypothetical protein [Puia sp.]|jgi:hypothetical protein|uniref:hypothetical protein n=1 Tax=Puia sp. TaxID=2045100 RepID=UPI002F3F17CB
MNENLNQREVTGTSLDGEVLKVLVDKTVDNGTAIAEIQKQIRQLSPEKMAAGLDQRMGVFEERVGKSLNVMAGLQGSIERYVEFFRGPTTKEVHHRHFLGWPIAVFLGMLVVMGLEWMLLMNAWGKSDLRAENDVLWRAAKLSDDSTVTRALDKVKRDYDAGPEQFGKDVATEEERRAELFAKWIQVNEQMGKIHALQQEKKTPGR